MFAPLKSFRFAALALTGILCLPSLSRPALADQRYLGPLIHQLRFAPDEDDREKAAKELGKLGDPAALPALHQAAVYDREDDVRDEARKSVLRLTGGSPPMEWMLFPNDRTGWLMRELLFARDDDDREKAAKELARLRDPRALPALEQAAIFDREDDVRDEARKAAEKTRAGLGTVREELTYRYSLPPAPCPPAERFEAGPIEPDFVYLRRQDNMIDLGPLPTYNQNSGTGNTIINNTYNYTYNCTYNTTNVTIVQPRRPAPTVIHAPPVVAVPTPRHHHQPTFAARPIVIEKPVAVRRPATVEKPRIIERPPVERPLTARPPAVRLPLVRPTPEPPKASISLSFEFHRSKQRN